MQLRTEKTGNLKTKRGETTMTEFKKYDANKPQLSLVPRELKEAVAEVMAFGAAKYGRSNWELCEEPLRYLDAAMRHIDAYAAGDICDTESGMPHLWHAACNIGFLIALNLRGDKNA